MSVLDDAARFAQDPSLVPPLTAAMVSAAVQVMAEDPTTAFHNQRIALATSVIRSPGSLVSAFAWAVSTNSTIVSEWVTNNLTQAESDLPFGVSSVWNAVAGAAAPAPS